MSAQRHLVLGLFFVVAFGVLGWFTLFKSDFTLFSDRFVLTVYFQEAGGLREGDSVLVAGMRWGKVETMSFDPLAALDRRVTVDLSLERPVDLYSDAEIRIRDATVLGGKVLSIEPGVTSDTQPELPLTGTVSPNVMEALSDVVRENRDALANVLSELERVVSDLREGEDAVTRLLYDPELGARLDSAVNSIASTFENAQKITDRLTGEDGERGTLGRLIYEDAAYEKLVGLADDLELLVDDARGLVADARQGEGTIATLLNDAETAARVRETVDRISDLIASVDRGEGTVGRLFRDDAIAKRVESLLTDLDEGRGTIGKLWKDEALYDDVRKIVDDVSDASSALVEGRGTLGRLLYEDDIYTELERAVGVLLGTLEEAREAAPISTFLNTVFLGF